jgi:hypothetical protein
VIKDFGKPQNATFGCILYTSLITDGLLLTGLLLMKSRPILIFIAVILAKCK